MKKNKILPLVLLKVFLLSGCTTIDPKLEITLEDVKSYDAPTTKTVAVNEISKEWWKDFNTSTLDDLIDKALLQSPDLLASYQKIEQAKIALNSAGAEYLPSLDLDAKTNASKIYPQDAKRQTLKSTSAQVTMSYELDVWGKIAASVEYANENISMSVYDYDALKLTLIADVTQNYFNYLNMLQRVQIAQNNLDIAQKVLNVMQARLRFGSINELDVSRQKTTLYNQKTILISLKNQLLAYKNALAILVGEMPSNFTLQKASFHEISIPSVNAGIPSELLKRRPDIASANAAIQASKASIMIADAMRYPSFSLNASAGGSSTDLLAFTSPVYALGAGLGVNYNIFDDGRLTNLRLTEESKAQATLQEYKKVVLTAFKEVEDALNEINFSKQNLELANKILLETKKTFQLATIQYKNGLIDFTTFLDIQQTFFAAQEHNLIAKQENLIALVTLYKALGGGFKTL